MNTRAILRVARLFFLCILFTVSISIATPPLKQARAGGPWYVTTAGNDSNDCLSPASPCATINAAIGKASSGDTIYVATGTYTGSSGNEVVVVDKNVTLSGGWNSSFTIQSGHSTIDGEHARRGVSSISGTPVTIERFVIANGYTTDPGGGIYNGSELTLINCIVQNNTSTVLGGGIYNPGILHIVDSTIMGNHGYNGGGIHSYGGAITIQNSEVISNTGGGVYIYGLLTATMATVSNNSEYGIVASRGQITSSTIQNNQEIGVRHGAGEMLIIENSEISGTKGTGIYNDGTITIIGTLIRNNQYLGGVGYGAGGLYNWGNALLQNSQVSGNSGVGIFNISEFAVLTVNNSAIIGNSGTGLYNSGTLHINNTTISGNTATTAGGGVFAELGTVELSSSTITENRITGGVPNPSYIGGAGIYKGINASVILQDTILAGNQVNAGMPGPDCAGGFTSLGYNLVGSTANCTFTPASGDLVNIGPRLFGLIGSPSYHPLLRGSPAIDAGNPTGCTDHLGNPLNTDQRGVTRVGRCDIGAYEYDPANDPIQYVHIPLAYKSYCPDFLDNFSNPATGWAVGEDSLVRSEYLNGEYRVLSKQAGYYFLFRSPSCDRENYRVEVDARWVGTPGASYGLIFGILGDFDHLYLFEVNTDNRVYELLRFDPTTVYTLVDWTASTAIHSGTASNHLKVTRHGTQIVLEVNGVVLGTWDEGSITGLTGMGLVSSSYGNRATSDARFDNFTAAYVSSLAVTEVQAAAAPGTVVEHVPRQSLHIHKSVQYR